MKSLVVNRLLRYSSINLCEQTPKETCDKLYQISELLLEVDDNDIKALDVKQKYTSKNLASNVYDKIKDFEPSLQDDILNSFNMYLIDDGTGKGCNGDKIDKSHLTIFGYPKNYSSMVVSVNSPLINNIITIENYNQKFNKVDNLEINTKNKNLKQFIRSIVKIYPELITMFDTSLKKQKGLDTIKNTLLSLKALHNDNLFKNLEPNKKNILISAIILNNISQSNEEDDDDRIVQNAIDASLITQKYYNFEDKKLISNLILVSDDNPFIINYACGLEHLINDGKFCDYFENNIVQTKMQDSIGTIFKGDQIDLYYLFQKYGKNEGISLDKFQKLKTHAAIANNIDLIIREALNITKLPNRADLLYVNCQSNKASCIEDGILTKDDNGFVIIDIAKMQDENIPQAKQEQYFKEMGINCKTVDDFRLLIHATVDLNPSSEVIDDFMYTDIGDKYTKCDPQSAISNMTSMELYQMGYQRLCASLISKFNNNVFGGLNTAFIINPDKTIFLDAAPSDFASSDKDSFTAHRYSATFGKIVGNLYLQDDFAPKIKSMNIEEIRKNYSQDIKEMQGEMQNKEYTFIHNEISIANINVAGIVIAANISNDEANPNDILKEPSVADYIKSKNIPIIRINLNTSEDDTEEQDTSKD